MQKCSDNLRVINSSLLKIQSDKLIVYICICSLVVGTYDLRGLQEAYCKPINYPGSYSHCSNSVDVNCESFIMTSLYVFILYLKSVIVIHHYNCMTSFITLIYHLCIMHCHFHSLIQRVLNQLVESAYRSASLQIS